MPAPMPLAPPVTKAVLFLTFDMSIGLAKSTGSDIAGEGILGAHNRIT